jgi:hypothetical protein
MERRFDIGAAVFALFAALFWFASAVGHLPLITTYWGQAPASDAFYVALQRSAEMNMLAAIFSGLSAFCLFLRIFCRSKS